MEQNNDVLQELSQNDLHGLAPETEEEEILRNISDPSFELDSIFAVISNGEAKANSNPDEETEILSVQQFQQQLEGFAQQADPQTPQQQQKDDCLAVVSSSSFNLADSSCLYNEGISNMAISNPLLHQRLTSSLSPLNSQGPGSSLLATVLASTSSRAASSTTSTIASSTSSSTVAMPSSSSEVSLIKEEVNIRKYLRSNFYSIFLVFGCWLDRMIKKSLNPDLKKKMSEIDNYGIIFR